MKKVLQITNGIAFISTVFINYLSNTGKMNGTTIGEVSRGLKTLFTPAGYAFSIWGLIYFLVFGFVIYQGRSLFTKVRNNDFVLKIGWWFVVSCLANCCWIVCWIYGYTGLSCICIIVLLLSLLKIVFNNKMELWDAPISVIVFLWWPFVIYTGWITVASIANISAYLVKINWDGFGVAPLIWTIVMIVVAVIVNLIVTWTRNMREFGLVGAWALIAIAVANKGVEEVLVYTAYIGAALIIFSSSMHAFKNRKTAPFVKLKEYFNK